MNTLQDAREAKAMWDRAFAGKREPVNLSDGRRRGVLAKLFRKAPKDIRPETSRHPAYGT